MRLIIAGPVHGRCRPVAASRRARRLAAACAVAFALLTFSAAAASASTISGRAFEDPSRTGAYQPSDPVLSGQQIYLFDGAGNYVGEAFTAADGTYSFTGLADGAYQVEYAAPSWWALRDSWVPDTTGGVEPDVDVQLTGSAEVDFGWRAIVRSTNLSAPISEYVGPNGLTVESFDDVVSAKSIYDTIMTGTVGGEAPYTTVYFDWGASSSTTTSVSEVNGVYSDYSARSYIAWDSWLDTGAEALGHEYGHAWARYYAYIVQQDPTLQSYLAVRGLWGNVNLNTSLVWSQWELIADDYRQLLGPPAGRSYGAMNGSVPPASQVPGLANYLANVFTQPPAPVNTAAPTVSGTPGVGQTLSCQPGTWTQPATDAYQWSRDGVAVAGATAQSYAATTADGGHALSCAVTATDSAGSATAGSAPVTVTALTLTALSISPTPVKTSGVASFTLSVPAAVTVQILTPAGTVLKTLMSGSTGAGTGSVAWARPKNVKAGTYTLSVTASAGGASASARQSFSVS